MRRPRWASWVRSRAASVVLVGAVAAAGCTEVDPCESIGCAGPYCYVHNGVATCICAFGSPCWERDAGAPPPLCVTTADCPADTVCAESGACIDATGDVCRLPATSGSGVGGQGYACASDDECSEGSACLGRTHTLVDGEYVLDETGPRACALLCNPCDSTCPAGWLCIALSTGGGFCASPAQLSSSTCQADDEFVAWCRPGLECKIRAGSPSASCGRRCVPSADDGETLTDALPSADCVRPTYCLPLRRGASGASFTCSTVDIAGIGGACSDSARCMFPDTCRNGYCTPRTGDCPAWTNLRFGDTCVLPGQGRVGMRCELDEDCASGACDTSLAVPSCQS